MTTSNTYYIPEDGIYQPKDNKSLSETEFLVVASLKRAIVETHNGNYNLVEKKIGDALRWVYQINTGDK